MGLLRELISLLLATSSHILRANLLTVTKDFSRTTDATVVSWTKPSNMLRQLVLLRRPITHTLQRHRHATPPHLLMPYSRSANMPTLPRTTPMHSRPNSTLPPSQSLLRQTRLSSSNTLVVFSLDLPAEPALITVCLLSATALKTALSTSSSRIPGAQVGETTDTSSSASKVELVSVVSNPDLHPSQPPTEVMKPFVCEIFHALKANQIAFL